MAFKAEEPCFSSDEEKDHFSWNRIGWIRLMDPFTLWYPLVFFFQLLEISYICIINHL